MHTINYDNEINKYIQTYTSILLLRVVLGSRFSVHMVGCGPRGCCNSEDIICRAEEFGLLFDKYY